MQLFRIFSWFFQFFLTFSIPIFSNFFPFYSGFFQFFWRFFILIFQFDRIFLDFFDSDFFMPKISKLQNSNKKFRIFLFLIFSKIIRIFPLLICSIFFLFWFISIFRVFKILLILVFQFFHIFPRFFSIRFFSQNFPDFFDFPGF